MILGLGIDLVEIDRMERSWSRFGQRLAARVLTEPELAGMPARPAAYLAARFAVKEAAAKALGTGFARGVTPQNFEVRRLGSGKPELVLSGRALEIAREMGVGKAHVSLTHERSMAAAVVILERA